VAALYRGLDEPLLQERATDVLDVGRRVVGAITGAGSDGAGASGVVVADELTPADAAGLDPARVLAIATARGSTTAHAAILARALGLPAVVGLGPGVLGVSDGVTLLLDGEAGTVTVDPGRHGQRREGAPRARRAAPRAARERLAEPRRHA
jgi:phosphocarrier protein FPr